MAGVVIVGAGPGIGTSVARRFGTAGLPVGLIARSAASIDTARATLAAAGVDGGRRDSRRRRRRTSSRPRWTPSPGSWAFRRCSSTTLG